MQKKEKGFTLIELLIVIAIIAILATIGLASFSSARSRARDGKRKADLDYVSKAVLQYSLDMGTYPAASGSFKAIIWDPAVATSLRKLGYVEKDIVAPNATEFYKYCANATDFALVATLENIPTGGTATYSVGSGGKDVAIAAACTSS